MTAPDNDGGKEDKSPETELRGFHFEAPEEYHSYLLERILYELQQLRKKK